MPHSIVQLMNIS